ncbi:oxidoreductase [Ameyamaea chiangmaiensis NBRC 103196]|uniref:SDR family oxidoreductase n=1 Tax=Ameyamaea chiangmaiensis TaxID=442969 RepID=A0A850P712_9PROT|nr:SDR family oxidoreductase [Ameyamaea chiangmaiensis]MBS4074962.1 SDR family oxidoreductase [Ameyamaea chiangmaiensis]NVN39728.1 SDR family oxidoreductase [Ameyamaea chiangmaiensis]GBQ63350.1 oxidoreductase [Ameyamaea chiangmaiensis NBRC 103196]
MNAHGGWSPESLPHRKGARAIVTGATGGLGLWTALGLARLGLHVTLAGRSAAKGEHALGFLRHHAPDGVFTFRKLDLASLASVRAFAETTLVAGAPVDVLVNNAGVMAPPSRQETQDGFELQFGTNHLGHFALTGLLMPALQRAAGGGTVVTVASLAAWKGVLPWGDLNARHSYSAFGRYRQSKRANLVFSLELARRSRQSGLGVHARAAHPGWALTDIIDNGPMIGRSGWFADMRKTLARAVFGALGQGPEEGTWPTLYAALDPAARDGSYYGPQGSGERLGAPGPAPLPPGADDPVTGARLWSVSEDMTGVRWAD